VFCSSERNGVLYDEVYPRQLVSTYIRSVQGILDIGNDECY
jgi:hypothetical protein